MFIFYFVFIQECLNAPSWLTPTFQFWTAIIATLAFFVAKFNLDGVRRAQSLQAQMNLINVENDVRKNYSSFMVSTNKFEKEALNQERGKIEQYKIEKETATELYFSSVDKLATLINSDFVTKQLKNKDWKREYFIDFKKAKRLYDVEKQTNLGFATRIDELTKIIEKWEQQIEKYRLRKKVYFTYLIWFNKPIKVTEGQ